MDHSNNVERITACVDEQAVIEFLGLLEPSLTESVFKLLLDGRDDELSSLLHRILRFDFATTLGAVQDVVRVRIGRSL